MNADEHEYAQKGVCHRRSSAFIGGEIFFERFRITQKHHGPLMNADER
jgi:hypothetical protein